MTYVLSNPVLAAPGERPSPLRLSAPLQRLMLALLWLTFFLNGFVLFEPAPCDALMMALIVLLPLCGLVRFTLLHGVLFAAFMIIVATGLLAAGLNEAVGQSVQHMLITLYLALFSVMLAAFITLDPARHMALIWQGYLCGAVVAAVAGIIGYFDLIPGSYELFTRYERARGTFKDANVFGPYLVPAFLYCFHSLLTRHGKRRLLDLFVMGILLAGILMSFSRGAWLMLLIASGSFILIYFASASTSRQRLQIVSLVMLCLLALAVVLFTALQFEKVQELWHLRTSLMMEYDVGDSGRFAGHQKAMQLILENPLGIGALFFASFYHHEMAHNSYLSMYLSSGWLGGTVFLILMLVTLVLGFRLLFKRPSQRSFYAIAFCSFFGLMVESYVIDTDHWRLLYILIAMIWGAYAAERIGELHDDMQAKSQRLETLKRGAGF